MTKRTIWMLGAVVWVCVAIYLFTALEGVYLALVHRPGEQTKRRLVVTLLVVVLLCAPMAVARKLTRLVNHWHQAVHHERHVGRRKLQ